MKIYFDHVSVVKLACVVVIAYDGKSCSARALPFVISFTYC